MEKDECYNAKKPEKVKKLNAMVSNPNHRNCPRLNNPANQKTPQTITMVTFIMQKRNQIKKKRNKNEQKIERSLPRNNAYR